MNLSQKQLDRFWSKVNKLSDDECWEWKSYTDGKYGGFYANGKQHKAHRISWILENGPIPNIGPNGKRMCVCHTCDNPPCVNPNHLFLGTDSDNAIDRNQKGRQHIVQLNGDQNPNSPLNPEIVKQAEEMLKEGSKDVDISKKLGINGKSVWRIKNKKHWSQRNQP